MIGSKPSLSSLPANVWILAVSQALALSAVPMMILIGGILSAEIAPDPRLVTLPLAMVIVGLASATVPASLLMKRIGRKRGGFVEFAIGFAALALGYWATQATWFWLLLASGFLLGAMAAFGQQFRFAAIECVDRVELQGAALSVMMSGGLLAAIVGPEIGARGRWLVESAHGFAGSYLLMGGALAVALGLFCLYREPELPAGQTRNGGRPLRRIVLSWGFARAALSAASAYGLMSLVMTATPVAMYELCGYSVDAAKQVIQAHILAMYIPSLVGGWLLRRVGVGRLMAVGTALNGLVLCFGFAGQELVHFWGALIALGVGWNFLFLGGTSLLPRVYEPNERHKAQAANDFMVFGSQALASLSSGWLLFALGWHGMLAVCMLPLAVAGCLAYSQLKQQGQGA